MKCLSHNVMQLACYAISTLKYTESARAAGIRDMRITRTIISKLLHAAGGASSAAHGHQLYGLLVMSRFHAEVHAVPKCQVHCTETPPRRCDWTVRSVRYRVHTSTAAANISRQAVVPLWLAAPAEGALAGCDAATEGLGAAAVLPGGCSMTVGDAAAVLEAGVAVVAAPPMVKAVRFVAAK